MKFKLYRIAALLCFPFMGYAQSNSFTSEQIETVCKMSESDAVNALANLAISSNNFKDLTLEKLRNSYIESMINERERLKVIEANTKLYQSLLDSSSENFKYALCQKITRPSATAKIISSEIYFLCRKTVTSGVEQKPPPCF
jgi:hypothetical protein